MTAGNSRIVRGATISVAQNQYIEAARSLGAGRDVLDPRLRGVR